MRSNVCLSGHPLAFGQTCRCILRTAIVPDEPIRAKGTEWGNFPLTLHLRRCPTSKLIPSVSRTFGAIFAPRLHSPRYSLVPRPPLTAHTAEVRSLPTFVTHFLLHQSQRFLFLGYRSH